MNRKPRVRDTRAHHILSARHLKALGRVAAEWGMLEVVLERDATMMMRTPVNFGLLTGNSGGRRHAELFALLAPGYLGPSHEGLGTLKALLAHIEQLADRRNDLIHAAWGNIIEIRGGYRLNRKGPSLNAFLLKARGKKLHQAAATAEFIETLAKEIGDARHNLNTFFAPFPYPLGLAPPQAPTRGGSA